MFLSLSLLSELYTAVTVMERLNYVLRITFLPRVILAKYELPSPQVQTLNDEMVAVFC